MCYRAFRKHVFEISSLKNIKSLKGGAPNPKPQTLNPGPEPQALSPKIGMLFRILAVLNTPDQNPYQGLFA